MIENYEEKYCNHCLYYYKNMGGCKYKFFDDPHYECKFFHGFELIQ